MVKKISMCKMLLFYKDLNKKTNDLLGLSEYIYEEII